MAKKKRDYKRENDARRKAAGYHRGQHATVRKERKHHAEARELLTRRWG